MKHKASCTCGQLSITYDGEFTKTSMCHCFDCQKRTGSVFGVQTRVDAVKTSVTGKSTVFKRKGDEGGVGTFHFCPICGSTVFWEITALPGTTYIATGAFANPQLPAPTVSVYKARKHYWVEIPTSITDDWD